MAPNAFCSPLRRGVQSAEELTVFIFHIQLTKRMYVYVLVHTKVSVMLFTLALNAVWRKLIDHSLYSSLLFMFGMYVLLLLIDFD